MKYSQQLKHLMNQENMSQQQLSEITGISKSSISQYVNGHNEPTIKNKECIESVLGKFEGISDEEEVIDRNVPIRVAAKKLGKSEQFIRVGLQNGIFNFGFAVKTSSKYSYHISPKKFEEYVGG